jgi:hypothetical protein
MQITRLFVTGQSLFAPSAVQQWLRERNQNPNDYDIIFHEKIAPPKSDAAMIIEIELKRKDGQPVDPWLQEEVNWHG